MLLSDNFNLSKCEIHFFKLMGLFYIYFSGQVLSITPNTQEQVEILKNVSTQYQVELFSSLPPFTCLFRLFSFRRP